jgi:hypothetical protein
MNRFRKLGFINYDVGDNLHVHSSLLSVVLSDEGTSATPEATNQSTHVNEGLEPPATPGLPPDKERAKRPPLAEPSATNEELSPGDRVEGLGNFGKPTGELGTVEQANEDDAVVKWDDDGRVRLHQPWLKKV